MEKFFIVTEESPLFAEYQDYKESRKAVDDFYRRFCAAHSIESKEYSPGKEHIYIVPTDADKEKFGKQLCKPINDGLCRFRNNSEIKKAWVTDVNKENLKILHRPIMQFYFENWGKGSSRLFDINDIVYCSYQSENVNVPDGMIEIKASEFYKVIEESEETENVS